MITVKAGTAWIIAFCVTLAVGGLLIHPLVAVVFGIMGLPATGTCVSMMYDNRRTTHNSPHTMQSEETLSNEESEKAEDEQPENDEVEDTRLRGLFEE